MSLESDVYTYLKSRAALTALLGTGDNFRLYPQRVPPSPTYPVVRYVVVSQPRTAYTHDNAGAPPAGTTIVRTRMQFDIWDSPDSEGGYEAVLAVRAALVAELSGFKGVMGATSIQSCFIADSKDDFEPDSGSNRRTVDAVLKHEEG